MRRPVELDVTRLGLTGGLGGRAQPERGDERETDTHRHRAPEADDDTPSEPASAAIAPADRMNAPRSSRTFSA